MPTPHVIPRPDSAEFLKKGFDQLADLLAVTLGPTQGNVVSWSETYLRPELLDDAAQIARRIIQIPDRRQDVGAMMLRQLVWRMHREVGDGGATAAVLAQALLDEGTRLIAGGAVAIHVQNGIKKASEQIQSALAALTQPANGQADLTAVASAVTGERELAWALGEMFDLLGKNAHITVEKLVAPYLERVYVDGARWDGKLASPHFINAIGLQRAVQTDCHVALFETEVKTSAHVGPLMRLIREQKVRRVLLVVPEISGEALNLLTGLHNHPTHQLQIIAFTLNLGGEAGKLVLDDLSLLTGATIMGDAYGRPYDSISAEHLGSAARIEATKDHLYISGGKGDRSVLRETVDSLKHWRDALPWDDERRAVTSNRIGQLAGRCGILKVGAWTQVERDVLHKKAERAVRSLTATVESGYLPGGGVGLLQAAAQIDETVAAYEDERLAMRAAQRAFCAPFLQIMRNALIASPEWAMHQVNSAEPGHAWDAVGDQLVDAREAGIVDPARVVERAVDVAVSGAVMALSVDVTILQSRPVTNVSYEP